MLADPRIKDMFGQTAASMTEYPCCVEELNTWIENPERTIELLNRRQQAIAKEKDRLATTQEQRRQIERDRTTERLVKAATEGDLDHLRCEILSLPSSASVAAYRDERGNSVLHLTAWHGHEQATAWLIEECRLPVDLRDVKGWTPLMIAAFHGQRKICKYLMKKGADAEACNDYNFSVSALAKDDEIRTIINSEVDDDTPKEGNKEEEIVDAYKDLMTMNVSGPSESKVALNPSSDKVAPKTRAKSRSKSRGKSVAKAAAARPRYW